MPNKLQRQQNANNFHRLMDKVGNKRQCPNCLIWHNKEGHYVPPSVGDEGFFICEKAKP